MCNLESTVKRGRAAITKPVHLKTCGAPGYDTADTGRTLSARILRQSTECRSQWVVRDGGHVIQREPIDSRASRQGQRQERRRPETVAAGRGGKWPSVLLHWTRRPDSKLIVGAGSRAGAVKRRGSAMGACQQLRQ